MKYYKIKRKTRFPELGRIASGAEGKNVPEKEYFYRIGKGEIIENTPIFDYFVLESFDKEKYWEWALFDIHSFIGEGSQIFGWYISDKLKSLLEKFRIAPKYHFYETRLLYKEEKFKYWIFQFPIDVLHNYNYDEYDYKIWKETKKNIEWRKIVLIDKFDIVGTWQGDILCSERLKQAIEENGITGFEFFEIDYEVVVE